MGGAKISAGGTDEAWGRITEGKGHEISGAFFLGPAGLIVCFFNVPSTQEGH